MSRIDDLIAEHCPDGVEFKALGQLCTVFNGYAFKSELFNSERIGLPIIRIRDVNTGFSETYFSGSFDERWVVEDGDILIGMDGDFRVNRWGHGRALLNQRVCRLQDFASEVLPGFVHYQVPDELDRIHSSITGSTVKHLSSRVLERSRIPVPSLEVQREIVRILDTFKELEAELEARRRQYAHYRDSLLDFSRDKNVPRKPFGSVATIVRGGSPRPIQAFLTDDPEGVNWIKIGDVPRGGKFITETAEKIKTEGASKSRRVAPGDFVLSNSMSFGRPYIVQIEGCIHDGWLAIKDFAGTYLPDFLYHLLRSTAVYRDMASRAGAGTVQNLNADIVKSLILPTPSFDEQARIVAILDSFDALVNDLSVGLPAELASRRKQYAYYRDRLLTFEEVS